MGENVRVGWGAGAAVMRLTPRVASQVQFWCTGHTSVLNDLIASSLGFALNAGDSPEVPASNAVVYVKPNSL